MPPPSIPPATERGGLTASDGLRLAWYRWDPAGRPRGTVCIAHGLREHSERYRHVAGAFADAGFVVFAFDWRGHGRSEGPRGHAPSYAQLLDDYGRLVGMATATPKFAYGHSMGGQIILNYGRLHPKGLDGVIATGPWLRLAFPAPAVKVLLGRILSPILPKGALPTGLKVASLSRDPEVVRAYQADPLIHDKLSFRLGITMLDGGEEVLTHAADFRLPVLVAHGDADRIIDPRSTEAFYTRAGSSDKTLRLYQGFYHEIHNEPEWARVLGDLTGWATERAG